MKRTRYSWILGGIGLLFLGFFSLASLVFAEKSETKNTKVGTLPLMELQVFAEVFDQIKKNYVKETSDTTLLNYAIEGMLTGLDPHSAYLDPDMFKDLQISTTGEFGGLGLEVTLEDGFVKVVSPIDDTPSQRAGIESGDVIVKIDDTPVKGLSLREAVEKMRGEKGTKVTLTIIRPRVDKPLTFTLVREIIQVKSVKSKLLEDGFGYLRVSQFQVNTARDLTTHVKELSKSSKTPIKGVILDLRNNPGGVLKSAIDVVDLFLNEGLIVYTEGRIENSSMRFKATRGDILKEAPIIVLVNGGSASAAEIVAGALQDHKRAIVVGTKSFGKGSVQTVLELKNERALKLTTALYHTPSGRAIQAEGIIPDITVEAIQVSQLQPVSNGLIYKEVDLRRHLQNGKEESGKGAVPIKGEENKTTKTEALSERPLAETDYQLNEALNLLKAITILKMVGSLGG